MFSIIRKPCVTAVKSHSLQREFFFVAKSVKSVNFLVLKSHFLLHWIHTLIFELSLNHPAGWMLLLHLFSTSIITSSITFNLQIKLFSTIWAVQWASLNILPWILFLRIHPNTRRNHLKRGSNMNNIQSGSFCIRTWQEIPGRKQMMPSKGHELLFNLWWQEHMVSPPIPLVHTAVIYLWLKKRATEFLPLSPPGCVFAARMLLTAPGLEVLLEWNRFKMFPAVVSLTEVMFTWAK